MLSKILTNSARIRLKCVGSLQFQLTLSLKRDPEMLIGFLRYAAPSGRSREKALLQQIRLVDVLQRDRFFVDRCGQSFQSHRPAAVKLDDAAEHPAVCGVQAKLIDFKTQKTDGAYTVAAFVENAKELFAAAKGGLK